MRKHRILLPYLVGGCSGALFAMLFLQIFHIERPVYGTLAFLQGSKSPLSTDCVKILSGLQERIVYVITPTHSRPQQKAELTRLSYMLKLAGNIHWLVVEDSDNKTPLVTRLLLNSKLKYTHLNAQTPPAYKLSKKDPNWLKPRGVVQRNAALRFLRTERTDPAGVVYFADDDNTYDVKLFEEMRKTKKVSVWPVGLVGGLMVERPKVVDGKVKRFNSAFRPDRPYPIDMASFAVSLQLLCDSSALFSLNVQRGYQESHLITQLISGWDELEPMADNCTKVYVWHTRTERPKMKFEAKLAIPSNDGIEV